MNRSGSGSPDDFPAGDTVMAMVPVAARYPFAALAVLLAALAAPAKAEDTDWRQRALALNDVTGEEPIMGQILTLVEDKAGTRKLLAAAVPLAKEKNQPFNYNAAYILARTARLLKDVDASALFYRICAEKALKLKSGEKLVQSYGGLIDLLYENKRYGESEKLCREVLEMDDDEAQPKYLKSAVMRKMIQTLAKQKKTEEALKLVNNLVKARGDDWISLELKAEVLREAGRNEEAAKTYEEVLDLVKKDKALKKAEQADFAEMYRYILSGVYVDLNRIDKAGQYLKDLLAQKPDDPTYNNDLGYIWADHDMNLSEAEKLIRKALAEDRKQRKASADLKPDEDRDNAAYLDSLGWVLFKQKKYKEAKEPLLAAVREKDGRHTEIYDHLGDVHMALGEKAEAVAAWQKALEVAGDSKREQERKVQIEKKLRELKAQK
jgi:tetratricopeptide (TPR) repeat protein